MKLCLRSFKHQGKESQTVRKVCHTHTHSFALRMIPLPWAAYCRQIGTSRVTCLMSYHLIHHRCSWLVLTPLAEGLTHRWLIIFLAIILYVIQLPTRLLEPGFAGEVLAWKKRMLARHLFFSRFNSYLANVTHTVEPALVGKVLWVYNNSKTEDLINLSFN